MPEKMKPVDRRVVKTKKAIKNAFARLLTQKDINDITVSDIAAMADINRKTFYNYYAGVHEVVDEIENDLIVRFDMVLTEFDFTKNINHPYMIFEKITAIINTDMDFFGFLLSLNANVSLVTKLVDMLKQKVKAILQKYMDIDEHKLELMLEFMISGVVAVYRKWFNSDRREPIEQLSADINLMIFEGLNGYLGIDLENEKR